MMAPDDVWAGGCYRRNISRVGNEYDWFRAGDDVWLMGMERNMVDVFFLIGFVFSYIKWCGFLFNLVLCGRKIFMEIVQSCI